MPDQIIREALREDLPAIVALLADDELGKQREQSSTVDDIADSYYTAFDAINADKNHVLLVVESDGELAGTMQLSVLPNLTYQGGWRAQIEAVRIHSKLRGSGMGTRMIEYAINLARERDCYLVQLTTNIQRPEAIRFYQNLGFASTHSGMKLFLKS
ncbi:MAG: GNAT family N-acetyltransferase [Gammaproteobacteria bacterium]|nr:GNAT family N-acetyltransferase [Gammaproteobacteria bacterium]